MAYELALKESAQAKFEMQHHDLLAAADEIYRFLRGTAVAENREVRRIEKRLREAVKILHRIANLDLDSPESQIARDFFAPEEGGQSWE